MAEKLTTREQKRETDAQKLPSDFAGAADVVTRRLVLRSAMRMAKATVLPVAIAGIVLLQLGVSSGFLSGGRHLFLALLYLLLWLGACYFWAWWRRPEAFAALAFWDKNAGRGEAFASSYFFESHRNDAGDADDVGDGKDAAGYALHCARTAEALPDALTRLPYDLPLPQVHWHPVPLLCLLFFAGMSLRPPEQLPGDAVLDAGMEQAAQEAAEALVAEKSGLEKMEALTAAERERLAALKEAMTEVVEELSDAAGKTASEVLDALEQRARDAEKLAERLGADGEAWASEEFLEELRQHADTVGLADAVSEKDARASADKSEEIASLLGDDALTRDAADRIGEALTRSSDKADEADRERPLGKHVSQASSALTQQQPAAASTEFSELAKAFQRMAEREEAQKKLEELASKLREAGSDIAGQSGQGMQQLAGAGSASQGQSGSPAGKQSNAAQNMSQMMDGQLPVPGLGKPSPSAGQGQSGKMEMGGNPVPGTKLPAGEGQNFVMVPGSSKDANGSGMLLPAPIPGTQPGATVLIPGAGGAMVGAMPGVGGLEAGHGTAPLGGDATTATTAGQQGLVNAAAGTDGDSSFRAVEGGTRNELAGRSRKDIAIDFIKVQEEALDEKPLPLSRRDHVRRYFNTIRKQFESE